MLEYMYASHNASQVIMTIVGSIIFSCWIFCVWIWYDTEAHHWFSKFYWVIYIFFPAIPNLLRALFAYQELVACSNPELSSLDLCDITGYVVLSIHAVERVILYVKQSTVTQTNHSPDKLKSLWKSATELTLVFIMGFVILYVCCFSQACVCVLPLKTLGLGPLLSVILTSFLFMSYWPLLLDPKEAKLLDYIQLT